MTKQKGTAGERFQRSYRTFRPYVAIAAALLVIREPVSRAATEDSAEVFRTAISAETTLGKLEQLWTDKFAGSTTEVEQISDRGEILTRYSFGNSNVIVVSSRNAPTYELNPVLSVQITRLDELESNIPRELRNPVGVIQQSPTIRGLAFNPTRLLKAVNQLQALGKETTLRAMSEYCKMHESHRLERYTNFRYGLDTYRIIPLGRLLFANRDQRAGVPEVVLGQPFPDLDGHGKPWALYPVLVESEIPFWAIEDVAIFGAPHSVADDLQFYRQNCVMIRNQLRPSATPFEAAERIFGSNTWTMIAARSPRDAAEGRALLQLQAIRAIGSLVKNMPQIPPRAAKLGQQQIGRMWEAYVEDPAVLRIHWNPDSNDFELGTAARQGR